MTAPALRVEVEGLFELRRALKSIDKALPKQLQAANKRAATPIADRARSLYGRLHPAQDGFGARSVRALASQTRAQVAMGGKKAPYMLGQEFGSNTGVAGTGRARRRGVRERAGLVRADHKWQFPPREEIRWGVPRWRGGAGERVGSKGNFFTPAVAEGVSELGEDYDKIIDRLMRTAFPDGRP